MKIITAFVVSFCLASSQASALTLHCTLPKNQGASIDRRLSNEYKFEIMDNGNNFRVSDSVTMQYSDGSRMGEMSGDFGKKVTFNWSLFAPAENGRIMITNYRASYSRLTGKFLVRMHSYYKSDIAESRGSCVLLD